MHPYEADHAMTHPIHYAVTLLDPHAHVLEVLLDIPRPDPAGQIIELPTWIPGSYMIREFARHVVQIEAMRGGRTIRVEKVDKSRWRLESGSGAIEVRYRVYAWDLSVRGAHFDSTHAFFNGTSVFMRVVGQSESACDVTLREPSHATAKHWRVATTLPRATVSENGFGRYRAADYDALIDHPVEIGDFTLLRFTAGGAPHEVAITGVHHTDGERLCKDLRRICAAQARLFEPDTGRTPFERYLFQVMAVGDGYGGLEHRDSTALVTRRDDLPWPGMRGTPEGYRRFLGLCSHEYFHAWHVKRIKPAAFLNDRLDVEHYTRLLWVFEGFTSYYDDLMLLRAGVITQPDYLSALATTVTQVLRSPGRFRQSVADSSHDAWIKYYRQDENAPNTIVSYYAKGALVALCLDALIRTRSAGQSSLDDVMRLLWARFGRHFFTGEGRISSDAQGLAEEGFESIVREATGLTLGTQLRKWVNGTVELPLEKLLAGLGVAMQLKVPEGGAAALGIRAADRDGRLKISTVIWEGSGHAAGLAAGDEIVAIDGLRADLASLNRTVSRLGPGNTLSVHLFRRDELREATVVIGRPQASEAALSIAESASATAVQLRQAWLTGR